MVYLDSMDLDLDLDMREPKSKSFVGSKLKEMDLDLVQMQLEFDKLRSMDLKYPHMVEFEISHALCSISLSASFSLCLSF